MKRIRWTGVVCLLVLTLAGASTAWSAPQTVTVGPTGAEGVDYYSIQTAIDYCKSQDPGSGWHTINIQAGTYDRGDEESLQTVPRNTNTWDGLGNVSDTEALLYIPVTNYLNGLRLLGASAATTIVDAEQGSSKGRVLYVGADNVVVSNLTLKSGAMTETGYTYFAGAGALVHGAGVTFSDCRFTACKLAGTRNTDVICNSYGTSTKGKQMVLRRVELDHNTNTVTEASSYLVGTLTSAAAFSNAVLNCSFHENSSFAASLGIQGENNGVVFGSVFDHETRGIATYNADYLYVANCTFADGSTNSMANGDYADNNKVLNCVIGYNGAKPSTPSGRYLYFMYNLIYETGFDWTTYLVDGYSTGSGDDGSNITDEAPSFQNRSNRDYSLASGSPCIDAADTVRTNATYGFVYVDVDRDSTYDAWQDVIVSLNSYTPTASDLVVTTDLNGNKRLTDNGRLDMGAYEFSPLRGPVFTFR